MARQPKEMDPSAYGIFAGSAIDEMNEMHEDIQPDGLHLTRHCEGCSAPKECIIDWAEILCLKHAIPPHRVGQEIRRPDLFPTQWVYDPQFKCMHPNYRCNCINRPLVMFNVTPDYAAAKYQSATRNGVIDAQQRGIIEAIAPIIERMSAQARLASMPQQQPPPGYQGQQRPVNLPPRRR